MDVLPSCCISLIFLSSFFFKFGLATTNSITTNKFLNSSQQVVSNNGDFKMGFFNSPNSKNRYVGIWYNNKKNSDSDRMSISDVIWIANRDNPLKDHYGVLKVSKDGNLQLIDGKNMIIWSTNISNNQENNSTSALLEDTGNLVLFSNAATIWQSFDFPVNSLLPSAVILAVNYTKKKPILQSWKNDLDLSSGKFTLYITPHAVPEIKTWDGARPYWRSGPWSSNLFFGVPFLHSDVVTGFDISTDHQSKLYITYTTSIPSLLEHLELRYDGNLIQKFWDSSGRKWDISWQSIESDCDIYGKCGPFGICNPKKSPICSCLKGFKPSNADEWRKGNYTRGCVRKIPLQCGTSTTGAKPDGFHMIKDTKVPDNPRWFLERNLDDCERKCLVNCSCLAFSYYSGKGCMIWSESLIDMQQSSDFNNTDVFFRLANAEFGEPIKWKLIVVTIVGILCATTFFLFMYYGWKRIRQRYGWKNTNKLDMQLYNVLDDRVNDFQDLPLFEFQKLEVATNFFSTKNKIGQGGFGPVYKGKLDDGKVIAVKRLSRSSGQGLQEFMNEVVVISKLQHKNLVRLLGCCIEREEKVLVYEYMPNKSLDAILFDPNYRKQLDWKKRFSIVKGICRGLLYLHRDSRLKIIHRDLKASNILLDEELNPKISDFGMARIFGTKQDQANTLRVVGTYGYMSPEYAMEGRFSEKSDVFSLGVLLLEIINGRKNNSFAASESMSLLSYAWKLWNENDILSFVDPTICDSCSEGQVLKCIQLGLLCVQEHPEDRPTISALTSMIDVEDDTDLPQPKQPGFTQMIRCTDYITENGSVNHVSLTVLSGR